MTKVAVILSGCGYLDGAEIRESVLTLLYLDQQGVDVEVFAPDIKQSDVVNHITEEPIQEERNVLVEAARIARGKVRPLSEATADNFDAIIIPGGYGVAKNLSDFASKGTEAKVNGNLERLISEFLQQKKPIGAICISPAVLVAAIAKGKVTIGKDQGTAQAIEAMGGKHRVCDANEIEIDEEMKIVSCPAYMLDSSLADIAAGIEKLVKQVIDICRRG